MDKIIAILILFLLLGTGSYVLITRVIIPLYKIYLDNLQIK